MTNYQYNANLENAYKQFQLNDLPIFQNQKQISIRKLFKILTIYELKDLSTVEALNFYLYCQFFKNRLVYSPIFEQNLKYINSKLIELKQRIKDWLNKFEQMLKETKSESDSTWVENNIGILNDGLIILESVPGRCDYYDKQVAKYLDKASVDSLTLQQIQNECAQEFGELSNLFSEIGRLIGRE
jgi:hypothetical protein